MKIKQLVLVWHAHHDCSSPLEFLTESYESRLETINTVKATSETPDKIRLRLKLFKRVTGELPASIIKAQAAREARDVEQEAWEVEQEAWEVVLEAWEAARETKEAAREDILKLHSAQCGCGWTPDNTNIFKYGLK